MMPILLTHWTYVTEKSSTTGFVSIRTGRDEVYRRRSTTKYSFLWSMHHKLLWWTEKCFQDKSCCLADNYEGTKVFNINAPGGCGKTFLLNEILAYSRGMGKKCIATASSGIPATLLKGGRTACSIFGNPIPILNTSTCPIKANSKLGQLILATELLIWDEWQFISYRILEFFKCSRFPTA